MRGAKTFLIGLVAVALLAAAVPGTAGAGPRERRTKLLRMTNSARTHHGIRRLDLNLRLSRNALRHSRRMADTNSVFHSSNLDRLVRQWRPSVWGENVGMAGTVRRVHRAFMRSSPHRANILNRRFRKVGIGVARARGRIWATVIFYGG